MTVARKAFALRLDPALYAALERLAAADLRSVNAEIEFLLREALKARAIVVSPPPSAEESTAESERG